MPVLKSASTLWWATGLCSLVAFTSAVPHAGPPRLPSLQFLAGKHITSVVVMKKADAPSVSAAQGTVTMAGPSEQAITRILTVKPGKTADELLLEQAIKRVQLTIVSPLGRSVYDSENSFERDAVTAALGQRYDPYISKPRTSRYPAGTPLAPATTDASFDNIWSTNVPTLNSTVLLRGLVVTLPAGATPGKKWQDSVRVGSSLTVNEYQILKKEGDILQVSLASHLLPNSQPSETSSGAGPGFAVSATSTVNALDYQGDLRVRQASGFIEELHLTKHSASVVKAGGQALSNDSYAKVDITNTVK